MRIPRRWEALQRQSVWVIRDLQAKAQRNPTDAEVAAVLEISLSEWQEIKVAYQNRALLSLDAPIRDEDNGNATIGDLVPDHQYRSFQLAQEDQIRLQQALVQLEMRTRQVLEFVFLHEFDSERNSRTYGYQCCHSFSTSKERLRISANVDGRKRRLSKILLAASPILPSDWLFCVKQSMSITESLGHTEHIQRFSC